MALSVHWDINNIMKTKVFILAFIMVFLAMVPAVKSQQLPVYSQYMMNSYLLNPAVAGHEGYTSLNLVAREQWIGLKDAPSTYAFSVQTRLLKNSFISRSASIRTVSYTHLTLPTKRIV